MIFKSFRLFIIRPAYNTLDSIERNWRLRISFLSSQELINSNNKDGSEPLRLHKGPQQEDPK
jgi:hypothetical protein